MASFKNDQSLVGKGNSALGSDYKYTDKLVAIGNVYWYKISSVNYAGEIYLEGTISAVPGIQSNQIMVFPNYPNPFNNYTIFSFFLFSSGNLKATVYDVRGKIIDVLADNYYQPGKHYLVWSSENYSSGVYFYQIENKFDYARNKIVMLK